MGSLETREPSDLPSIPEFYKGKNILITGGTGFMGQTLIEKLLYSCADLEKVYLIIRPKKGVSSENRLKVLYETTCFNRLREERPGVFETKVVAVDGDTGADGLGLSDRDKQLLIDNVDIIFNGAASVRFDDYLPVSAKLNLKSTYEIIELAKQMKKLCAIIHISTAYANCDRFYVEEKLYPPKANWRDTLEVCENLDLETVKAFTQKYIGKDPNTYIFTKQLAEDLVSEQRGILPLVIFRPSIVIAAMKEPFLGFVNNFNGPTGIIVACGKGIMRSIYAKPDIKADMVPVDYVIRELIVAAWYRGTKKLEPTDEVPIYNCCNSGVTPLTWHDMILYGRKAVDLYPMDGILWNPHFSITYCPFYHYIKVMTLQVAQALIVDTILWLLGKQPLLIRIQRKMFAANTALQHFMTNEWKFDNTNSNLLRTRIKEEDREQFYYTLEDLDIEEFYQKAAKSGIDNFLKAAKTDLQQRKAHLFRLRVVDFIATTLVCGYLLWYFLNTSFARNITMGVQQFFDKK